MTTSKTHCFRSAAMLLPIAALIAFFPCGFARAQVLTSASLSLSPQAIYQGMAPIATVTVTASDGSSPNANATCSITTRGHTASYSANVVSGTATMSLSSIAQVPVGTYSLACKYVGSAAYAASSAPTTNFQVRALTPSRTSVSAPPTPVSQGTAPVATVTVAVSGNSNPPGTVSCIIRARGQGAAYRESLASGSATITFASLAQAPVGAYLVGCSYEGAGEYATSSAAPFSIKIVGN